MASLATDMEQLSVQENEEMHLQKISGKKVPLDAENWFLDSCTEKLEPVPFSHTSDETRITYMSVTSSVNDMCT